MRQPLEVLHSSSSRGLRENMTRSWRGMEDAHLKIPKRWMYAPKLYTSFQGWYSERNVNAGMLGCQVEGFGMIMVHAS